VCNSIFLAEIGAEIPDLLRGGAQRFHHRMAVVDDRYYVPPAGIPDSMRFRNCSAERLRTSGLPVSFGA
jgi:hypothetical protein